MPATDKLYGLPRDKVESSRLDAQHQVFAGSAGYLLHPRIRSSLEKRPAGDEIRIADVATGTGVWLFDLAKNSPSTWQFTGLDLSDAQFPSKDKLDDYGSRVDFQLCNVLEPPPDHLRGAFDVVHLRLLVCGIKVPEWTPAAQNVLQLLKPGGWIQWHELGAAGITFYAQVPDAPTQAGEEMHRHAIAGQQRVQKFMDDDGAKLEQRIAKAGFEGCKTHKFASDRIASLRHQGSLAIHGAIAGMLWWSVENDPGNQLLADEVDRLVADARAELEDDRCYLQWDMWVVTGRRPSQS